MKNVINKTGHTHTHTHTHTHVRSKSPITKQYILVTCSCTFLSLPCIEQHQTPTHHKASTKYIYNRIQISPAPSGGHNQYQQMSPSPLTDQGREGQGFKDIIINVFYVFCLNYILILLYVLS